MRTIGISTITMTIISITIPIIVIISASIIVGIMIGIGIGIGSMTRTGIVYPKTFIRKEARNCVLCYTCFTGNEHPITTYSQKANFVIDSGDW